MVLLEASSFINFVIKSFQKYLKVLLKVLYHPSLSLTGVLLQGCGVTVADSLPLDLVQMRGDME